jgi:hypothetical protein
MGYVFRKNVILKNRVREIERGKEGVRKRGKTKVEECLVLGCGAV